MMIKLLFCVFFSIGLSLYFPTEKKMPKLKTYGSPRASLESIFRSFCEFGVGLCTPHEEGRHHPKMDNAQFAKLTRDTGLLDNLKLTLTDVDIIFQKAVYSSAIRILPRRITFATFCERLIPMLAGKLETTPHVIAACIVNSAGPKNNNGTTMALCTKGGRGPAQFHNPDTYTGVYARGGPDFRERGTPLHRWVAILRTAPPQLRTSYGDRPASTKQLSRKIFPVYGVAASPPPPPPVSSPNTAPPESKKRLVKKSHRQIYILPKQSQPQNS